MSERPPFVVRSSDVTEAGWSYPPPFDTERLSLRRELGEAAGSRSMGVTVERLLPGRRSSFTHAHLREEELVYVLSGRPVLRWIAPGDEPRETELLPGDFVAFPAATGIAHTFWNRTEEEAELLVIGERRVDERITYPEDRAYAKWRSEHQPLRTWTDVRVPSGEGRWPAFRIETPRVTMRPWEPSDTHALLATQAHNRDHLLPWMLWARELPPVDELLARIVEWQRLCWLGRDVVYGVFSPEGKVIGGTGFHDRVGEGAREIGYWVDRDHGGQGYVTDWCAALVRVAFEVLELDRLEIHCDPENVRSAAVAQRLGFRHEATLARRTIGIDGLPRDAMIWTMFEEEFARSARALTEVRAWDAVGRRLI